VIDLNDKFERLICSIFLIENTSSMDFNNNILIFYYNNNNVGFLVKERMTNKNNNFLIIIEIYFKIKHYRK